MADSASPVTALSATRKVVTSILLCAFLALIASNQTQANAFMPLYNEARNISMSYTGITLGSLDIGGAVSTLILAPIMMTKFSTRALLTVTASCIAFIEILCSCLDFLGNTLAYEILSLVFLFTIGSLNGVCYVTVMCTLVAIYPNNVATISGISESIVQAGFACGPFIGAVLYVSRGFKLPFALLGSLFLASVAPVSFLPNLTDGRKRETEMVNEQENRDHNTIIEQADEEKDISEVEPMWSRLADVRILFPIWHLAVSQILSSFHVPQISLHAKNDLDADVVWAGAALMLTAAMNCIFSPFLGILTDKYGPWKMMIASSIALPLVYICVGPLPLLYALNITPSKRQLMLAMSFLGIALAMANLPAITATMYIYRSKYPGEVPKWARDALISLYGSFWSIGLALGTSLSGFVAPYASFGWSTGTLGLLYILESFACIVFCVNEMKISRTLEAERENLQSNDKEYGTTNVSS